MSKESEVEPPEPVLPPEIVPREKRRPERIRLGSFLPRSRSKAVFVIVMSCYSTTLGFFIVAWERLAHIPRPPPAFYLSGDVVDVIYVLIVGPIIESLMLIGVFELLRRVRAREWVQVFAAALFISELHAWPWWPHAVIVLPSFCIYAASYLYWRSTSWKTAFWVVVSIHALDNVLPALSTIILAMRHT